METEQMAEMGGGGVHHASEAVSALAQWAERMILRRMPAMTIRHALWSFGAEGGVQPGGRDEKALELFARCDASSLAALQQCAPFADLAVAWEIAREPGGLELARGVLAELEAQTAARFGMPRPQL